MNLVQKQRAIDFMRERNFEIYTAYELVSYAGCNILERRAAAREIFDWDGEGDVVVFLQRKRMHVVF